MNKCIQEVFSLAVNFRHERHRSEFLAAKFLWLRWLSYNSGVLKHQFFFFLKVKSYMIMILMMTVIMINRVG